MPKILKSVAMRDLPRIINSVPLVLEVKPSEVDIEMGLAAEKILQEANEQAKNIIAAADNKINEKIADAESHIESLKEQAQEAGFQQGYREGYDQGKQTVTEEMQGILLAAVEKSERIIALSEQEARASILAAEKQFIEIALSIARKILAREVEENPMVILPIVKKALEKVSDQEQIVIKVHPDDYELVLQARRDLQMILGQEQALTIAHDHTVEIGSCVIESSNGTVDARVSTQFAALEKILQEIAQ
ncbi:flagellar assembly protein FliH [Sporomusaceae bacterium FL31]|nr:flagellar assembly protein FliH [Sporomusaceae bacterium FL31]GCE32691.1 flagellar assembly protein FliH [Sporomusaceae bacterium]